METAKLKALIFAYFVRFLKENGVYRKTLMKKLTKLHGKYMSESIDYQDGATCFFVTIFDNLIPITSNTSLRNLVLDWCHCYQKITKDFRAPIDKEAIKKSKIPIANPEEMVRVQKALFQLGYRWCDNSATVKYIDAPFLYISLYGGITFGDSIESFCRQSHKLVLPESILSIFN